MRVLIVEDDPMTSRSLEMSLRAEGMVVDATGLGEDGLEIGKLYEYDIILLDLVLPDMDGYEVLRRLRASRISTPVLILSGLSEADKKVKGLGFGADDYLTKPFDTEELLARVRTALRHRVAGDAGQTLVAVGDIEIDLERRRVRRAQDEVHLSPKEYDVLAELARRPDRVIGHRQLLRTVWGPAHEDHVDYLRIVVRNLRQKLEVDPARPRLITNEPGVGYRLAAGE